MHIAQKLPLLVMLVLSGCAAENLSETTGATTGVGAAGSILGKTTISDAEFEIKWEGEKFKLEADDQPATLVLQQVDFAVGGHTGWHTHAGPVIVMVTAGELTIFESDAPCQGRVFKAGESFIDGPGFGVHIAKNTGSVPAQVKATHMLPSATSPLRVDAPAPAGAELCP